MTCHELPNTLPLWIPAGMLKLGDVIRVSGDTVYFMDAKGFQEFNPERYRKEKMTMKPGPYKSRTHGPIPLSLHGRELMMELRNAITGGLEEVRRIGGQSSRTADKISSTRGDLAKYMSDLEYTIDTVNGGVINARPKIRTGTELWHAYGGGGPTNAQRALDEAARRRGKSVFNSYFPWYIGMDVAGPEKVEWVNPLDIARSIHQAQNLPKETPVKEDPKVAQSNETQPVQKTRSQLIAEATTELLVAQRELEYIVEAPEGAANNLTLYIGGSGILGEGIKKLVEEQFDALRKKVTARAKSRVVKAEAAVQELLAK